MVYPEIREVSNDYFYSSLTKVSKKKSAKGAGYLNGKGTTSLSNYTI